jgi:hypothetical protein
VGPPAVGDVMGDAVGDAVGDVVEERVVGLVVGVNVSPGIGGVCVVGLTVSDVLGDDVSDAVGDVVGGAGGGACCGRTSVSWHVGPPAGARNYHYTVGTPDLFKVPLYTHAVQRCKSGCKLLRKLCN